LIFNYNSIKEYKHDKNEFGGWKVYKVIMIFKDAKVGAKGARAFVTQTCFLVHPKVKLQHK